MKYPLIYSLSTVGMLKHYNQDYLIHEQRTDFTGANGVGKSIIADIFQLIFINDKQLFQFGTESYKKEARQLHKLPHRCKDAFAFLTLEIEAEKFICIGICIPNTSSRPLKPFIITADPDTTLAMKDRAFSRDKLPVARHFVNTQGRFSVVEELGKRFRDSYGLYFEYYSTSDQKDEHYGRLYDQELLPVDLSVPSSKRAFAKIVQSFSRARSSGDRSEELKDFLFDGMEKELEQTFDSHKTEIERQLRDYDELQVFIADLEAKQLRLEELHALDDLLQTARKNNLLGNSGYSLHASNRAKTAYEHKIAEYRTAVEKSGLMTARLPTFRRLADGYEKLAASAQTKLDAIAECKGTAQKISSIEKRIIDLTLDDLPDIQELGTDDYNIEDYADQELLKRIQHFTPVYRQYGSIFAIEQITETQQQLLLDRRNKIKADMAYHELIISLFTDPGEDTLIAQVLCSTHPVSPAQEAVLFHLLKTHWGKPNGLDFPYYAEAYDFFSEERILPMAGESGAFWLELGGLFMQVPPLNHQPVFGSPELRSQAAAGLAATHRGMLDLAEAELQQLQQFEKGLVYDKAVAPCLDGLDVRLNHYSAATALTETAQLILQLDGKTERLILEKEELRAAISSQLKKAGIMPKDDLIAISEREKANLAYWKPRASDYRERVIKDTADEKTLRESSVPLLSEQTQERKSAMDRAEVMYLAARTELEKYYPELITEALPEASEVELSQLKQRYDKAELDYSSAYRAACEQFKETANGANPELAVELKEGRYSFPLLERALLGGRVMFRDHIAEELRTANRSRHKLVASIHETMLKIFSKTKSKYDEYQRQIWDLNVFFKGKTISNNYFFNVEFKPSEDFPIAWINQLQQQSGQLYKPDELPIGQPVEVFVEDFFKTAAGYRKRVAFRDLLDPRTYFTLDAGLQDSEGKEVSGSTGETYSAKVLLGIGRLSKVQSANRPGIRFIILEETANLDKTNFNNFPAIAEEFGYQIITMTPKPFGSDGEAGWYLHHLIPGVTPAVNERMPASYFKTCTGKEDLVAYLKRTKG
jgi:exonuclease SbcC